MRDQDRPLESTGRDDAAAMGAAMRGRGYRPDLALCSTATRTRQTLEIVASQTAVGDTLLLDSLYCEDAAHYLDLVRANGDAGAVLVVGHNPMMEDLAAALSGSGENAAHAALDAGFPTCGLAVIDFPGSLRNAERGGGRLSAFLAPADL